MKKIIIFITLLSTMACTNTNINNSYKQSKEEFQIYQEISNNYKIDKEWWKGYNNSELNNIMNIALKNNSDLKKAAINVNKALYQANLLGANLVPSFSSSLGTSASKNLKTGGSSTIKHSVNISLSYELDLWKKLANTKNAQEWEYQATEASYESAKVDFEKSIISSLNEIDTYYKSYQKANSSYSLQEKNLKSQKDITKHYKNRYDNGNVEFKSWLEALINEKDSELNLLKAKFDIIQAENKIYQAMGGKAK